MTFTSLHYNTRYRWRELGSEKFEARLTSFDIVAEVDRRQSWTTRPTDERLLDHEQGHFDVSELNARRIQKKFNELISSGGIIGHGSDETAAIADMNQQVEIPRPRLSRTRGASNRINTTSRPIMGRTTSRKPKSGKNNSRH